MACLFVGLGICLKEGLVYLERVSVVPGGRRVLLPPVRFFDPVLLIKELRHSAASSGCKAELRAAG
jgi:hypothetical protein